MLPGTTTLLLMQQRQYGSYPGQVMGYYAGPPMPWLRVQPTRGKLYPNSGDKIALWIDTKTKADPY